MEDKNLEGNIEIPEVQSSSLKGSLMALQLSNTNIREWVQKRREGVQPWGEFLNWNKLKPPKAIAPAGARIVKNIEKFQSNYLFVFVGLFAFCILTSPMLLFALAGVLGACFVINHRNQDNKLKIMGKEVTIAQQYGVVGVVSCPIVWLAGAGAAVFWVIGASVVGILLHAGLRVVETEHEQLFIEPPVHDV